MAPNPIHSDKSYEDKEVDRFMEILEHYSNSNTKEAVETFCDGIIALSNPGPQNRSQRRHGRITE